MSKKSFSRKDALLEHLLQGHPITVLESMILFGIPNLTVELTRFRKRGWVVKRRSVPFARIIARVNRHATLSPPDNLDIQSMQLTEWWISQ